jgi:hypothetical protein
MPEGAQLVRLLMPDPSMIAATDDAVRGDLSNWPAARQAETGRQGMKLTVFGATGRIGDQVARHALDAGHHVTAVVLDPAPSP